MALEIKYIEDNNILESIKSLKSEYSFEIFGDSSKRVIEEINIYTKIHS